MKVREIFRKWWVEPTTFAIGIVLVLSCVFIPPQIRSSYYVHSIEPGDTVLWSYHSRDPFEEKETWGGVVVDKKGRYIQYRELRYGEVCSTDIKFKLMCRSRWTVCILKKGGDR